MIRFLDHGMGAFTPRRGILPCMWDRFDLICVHRGAMELRIEKRHTLPLTAGCGVLLYPHTRFQGHVARGTCRTSVQHFMIDARAKAADLPAVLWRLAGKRNGFEKVRFTQTTQYTSDIARAMDLAFVPQTTAVLDQRRAILTLILSQLSADTPTAIPGTRQAWDDLQQWMGKHLHETLTVHAMAERMGLSAAHFNTRFKGAFGLTPAFYFQRLRIQETLRLLRETDLPIKTIARRLGFEDLPNFYRTFRLHVSATPADYRTRHTPRG